MYQVLQCQRLAKKQYVYRVSQCLRSNLCVCNCAQLSAAVAAVKSYTRHLPHYKAVAAVPDSFGVNSIKQQLQESDLAAAAAVVCLWRLTPHACLQVHDLFHVTHNLFCAIVFRVFCVFSSHCSCLFSSHCN